MNKILKVENVRQRKLSLRPLSLRALSLNLSLNLSLRSEIGLYVASGSVRLSDKSSEIDW